MNVFYFNDRFENRYFLNIAEGKNQEKLAELAKISNTFRDKKDEAFVLGIIAFLGGVLTFGTMVGLAACSDALGGFHAKLIGALSGGFTGSILLILACLKSWENGDHYSSKREQIFFFALEQIQHQTQEKELSDYLRSITSIFSQRKFCRTPTLTSQEKESILKVLNLSSAPTGVCSQGVGVPQCDCKPPCVPLQNVVVNV